MGPLESQVLQRVKADMLAWHFVLGHSKEIRCHCWRSRKRILCARYEDRLSDVDVPRFIRSNCAEARVGYNTNLSVNSDSSRMSNEFNHIGWGGGYFNKFTYLQSCQRVLNKTKGTSYYTQFQVCWSPLAGPSTCRSKSHLRHLTYENLCARYDVKAAAYREGITSTGSAVLATPQGRGCSPWALAKIVYHSPATVLAVTPFIRSVALT